LSKPAQIARLDATVSDIVTDAVLAAHQAQAPKGKKARRK